MVILLTGNFIGGYFIRIYYIDGNFIAGYFNDGYFICGYFIGGYLIISYNIDTSCVKVKSSMARSLQLANLLPQNVGSIIKYLQ